MNLYDPLCNPLTYPIAQYPLQNGTFQVNGLNLKRMSTEVGNPVVEPKKVAEVQSVNGINPNVHLTALNMGAVSPIDLPTPSQQSALNVFSTNPSMMSFYMQDPGIQTVPGFGFVQQPVSTQEGNISKEDFQKLKSDVSLLLQYCETIDRTQKQMQTKQTKDNQNIVTMINNMQTTMLNDLKMTIQEEFLFINTENKEASTETNKKIDDLHRHTLGAVAANVQVMANTIQIVHNEQKITQSQTLDMMKVAMELANKEIEKNRELIDENNKINHEAFRASEDNSTLCDLVKGNHKEVMRVVGDINTEITQLEDINDKQLAKLKKVSNRITEIHDNQKQIITDISTLHERRDNQEGTFVKEDAHHQLLMNENETIKKNLDALMAKQAQNDAKYSILEEELEKKNMKLKKVIEEKDYQNVEFEEYKRRWTESMHQMDSYNKHLRHQNIELKKRNE